MATEKTKDETPEVPASDLPRSGARVKVVLRRSEPNLPSPSTLPPAPFESEAEALGLEWWLDAHMALASDLLCLGQALDGAPPSRAMHAGAVRDLGRLGDAVRDALYELYCDAAHPRAADLPGFLPAIEPRVRDSYSWCAAVAALLTQIANQLRSEGGKLDWTTAKADYRLLQAKVPAAPGEPRELLRSLPLDFASPVEPLRHLPDNFDHLDRAVAALDDGLSKRFA